MGSRPLSPAAVLLAWTGLGLIGCGPEPAPDPYDCTRSGAVCTVMGTGAHGDNGDGLRATRTWLYYPSGIDFFADGSPLIVDFNNMRIRTIDPDGRGRTLAGYGFHGGARDGISATESALENPIDGLILPDGGFLIAEYHTGRILEVDPTGWLTVLAGIAELGYSGDGGPAREARLSEAVGLAIGDDGRIFVADTDNHCIRVIDRTTGQIDLIAGDGNPGDDNGAFAAARFNEPWHLAWHDGALLVADRGNHRIRRVDLGTGDVSTVAGTGVAGFSGDGGPATEAQLDLPSGLAVDSTGAIWVADRMNHVVRRIDPDGTITTEVGIGQGPGDGPDAGDVADSALLSPDNVAVDPEGRVWIADTHNSKIRVYVP